MYAFAIAGQRNKDVCTQALAPLKYAFVARILIRLRKFCDTPIADQALSFSWTTLRDHKTARRTPPTLITLAIFHRFYLAVLIIVTIRIRASYSTQLLQLVPRVHSATVVKKPGTKCSVASHANSLTFLHTRWFDLPQGARFAAQMEPRSGSRKNLDSSRVCVSLERHASKGVVQRATAAFIQAAVRLEFVSPASTRKDQQFSPL